MGKHSGLGLLLCGVLLLCACGNGEVPVSEGVSMVESSGQSVLVQEPEVSALESAAAGETASSAVEESSAQQERSEEPAGSVSDSQLEEASSGQGESDSKEAVMATDRVLQKESRTLVATPYDSFGEKPAFRITDRVEVERMTGYVLPEKMIAIEDPILMGGSAFKMTFSDDRGSYVFHVIDAAPQGKCYVVIDEQWYLADEALWYGIVSYYPMFDNRIRPVYYLSYFWDYYGTSGTSWYFPKGSPRESNNSPESMEVYRLIQNLTPLEAPPDVTGLEKKAAKVLLSYEDKQVETAGYVVFEPVEKDGKYTVYVALLVDSATNKNDGVRQWYVTDKTLYNALVAWVSGA